MAFAPPRAALRGASCELKRLTAPASSGALEHSETTQEDGPHSGEAQVPGSPSAPLGFPLISILPAPLSPENLPPPPPSLPLLKHTFPPEKSPDISGIPHRGDSEAVKGPGRILSSGGCCEEQITGSISGSPARTSAGSPPASPRPTPFLLSRGETEAWRGGGTYPKAQSAGAELGFYSLRRPPAPPPGMRGAWVGESKSVLGAAGDANEPGVSLLAGFPPQAGARGGREVNFVCAVL